MPRRRTHSDILIAGLILLGMLMMGAFASVGLDLQTWTRAIPWFIAAFIAAQLARRVLPDLAIDEVVIAAAVTIAIVMGISYKVKNQPLELGILLRIGVGEAGAIAGAFTARAREPIPRVLLIAAAGAAGLGGGVILTGPALLATNISAVYGTALLVGSAVGAFAVALYTPARGRDAALGLAIPYALLFAVSAKDQPWFVNGVIGLALGAVLGSIGGAVGAALRARRKAELPEARIS